MLDLIERLQNIEDVKTESLIDSTIENDMNDMRSTLKDLSDRTLEAMQIISKHSKKHKSLVKVLNQIAKGYDSLRAADDGLADLL